MYNRTFWLSYLANTALMICVSVMFRYADFVQFYGGQEFEFTLGRIVGVGMVGSLAMRGILGLAMDRYGAHRVWIFSLLGIIASLLLHMAIASVHGPAIYAVRILYMVGLAGAFGASITFMSLRAPRERIGEMVGTLGSSGFIGLATGPVLGDLLFSGASVSAAQIQRMFLLAALAAGVSLVLTLLAARGSQKPQRESRPPMLALLREFHPGWMLIVAMAMGLAVMMPHSFLRPFAQSQQIEGIGTFFVAYATVAFVVRLVTRRFTDLLGVKPVVLLGLACMSLGMLSYLLVSNRMMLILPAALGGLAHAFLFPAVVTGGSLSFPARYRGLATTLVLAMFDISNMLGQPVIGGIIEFAPRFGLPAYPTMFVWMAAIMLVAGGLYAIFGRVVEHSDDVDPGLEATSELADSKSDPEPELAKA